MKESIEYNYGIEINEFNEGVNCSNFIFNKEQYIFCEYKRNNEDIKEIIECSKELKSNKILSFDIMNNKDKKVITKIDDENYVLLKLPKNYNEEIDLIDIINYNKKTRLQDTKKKFYKNNWGELWSQKIDYFEYQISELGEGKQIILDSFSYFIGLAENAISLVNKCNKENNYGKNYEVSLSHRRIFYPNIVLNYFNPLSYIIDLEVRDIAEYIKSCFYEGEDAILELETFLKSVKLSDYSYQMFYARLVFPSLYFDCYENAIRDKEKEENIIKIIKSVDNYECFLKDAYTLINKLSKIESIEWLT